MTCGLPCTIMPPGRTSAGAGISKIGPGRAHGKAGNEPPRRQGRQGTAPRRQGSKQEERLVLSSLGVLPWRPWRLGGSFLFLFTSPGGPAEGGRGVAASVAPGRGPAWGPGGGRSGAPRPARAGGWSHGGWLGCRAWSASAGNLAGSAGRLRPLALVVGTGPAENG